MSKADDILVRRAPAGKSSWDPKNRTLEIVASTFGDVRRYGYVERLSDVPADWNFDRVASPAGVPFLDSHNSYTSSARLGRVTAMAVAKSGVRATVKLNDSPAANALVAEIEAGTAPGISIGYTVGRWSLVEESDDAPEIRVAKEISILEVSAVSVAADPGAHIRQEANMPNPRQTIRTPATDPIDEPIEENVQIFGPAERKRMVEKFGLDQDFYRRHARKDEAAFRAAVLDALVDESEDNDIRSHAQPRSGRQDEVDTRREAMAEALAYRVAPAGDISEPARQYVGLTIPELARSCLEHAGQRTTGMSQASLVRAGLNTTSDFPMILANTVNRRLRAGYQAAPSAIKQLARKTTARDFKEKQSLTLSEASRLLKVNEHGEYPSSTFLEVGEKYKLATFGRIFGITRQALVNDELNAFDSVPTKLGRAADAFEAQFLSDLIAGNPKMSDGKAVFHTDHKNLGTAAALSVDSLSAARLAMRKQVGLGSASSPTKPAELISVTPKYLLVPPDLETTAEKVLAEIAAATVGDVNPFSKKLTLVVEPRLTDAKAWYVAASTGEIEGIEYAHLEGEEGPQIETEQGFDIDGMRIKVRLDFGAAFIEWRSWFKNPGV